jgi:energy-coupling factor transporter ATP-binding protein EcfA2
LDFFTVNVTEKKDGTLVVRPDWRVGRSEDLMTRGGSFYAIWDEARQTWSTNIYDVQRLVDEYLWEYRKEIEAKYPGQVIVLETLEKNHTRLWEEFHRYLRHSGNCSNGLDEKIVFANTEVKKTDYSSKRLPYELRDGDHSAWDELIGTLYNEEERAKIEWAIGAVVSGDSKHIQKFLVFYGPPASGKSTMLNIIEKLFEGYTAVFDARELAGNNNTFATSAFKTNPLVAIQHDGDLSRIVDNTKINSLVSHEVMSINEKYKTAFEMRSNAMLFMGTNVPVKITNAKSGVIRRLIDVVPSLQVIEHSRYNTLLDRINFELGAIAKHCYDRYKKMGATFYSDYQPREMMLQTDVFYNYVEAYFDIFKNEDRITLKRAWDLYKAYCDETNIEKMLPQYKFREELKNYFEEFQEREVIDGKTVRSIFRGFKELTPPTPRAELPVKTKGDYEIVLSDGPSIFDETYRGMPAQLAKADGSPKLSWGSVTTTLSDIDTHELHWVKVPDSHIVIDFDLTNEEGEKSLERNLAEASKWPPTYAEVSKSGHGIHLHYIYTGDPTTLATQHDEGIEVKALLGNSALRRRLTRCNSVTFSTIHEGLRKKYVQPVLSNKAIKTEKGLRELIGRNLRKEIHPGTKPSVDFIHKILEEAYDSGMSYDLSDLKEVVYTFAAKSTHQAGAALKIVKDMKFVGQQPMPPAEEDREGSIVFFDIEVYPNLFVVCWKPIGTEPVVRMINPTAEEIEPLLAFPLVGFNNRRYDNHILYARYIGYSIEDLYALSQRIITGGNQNQNMMFGEAYNLSYADIYDFSSVKKGLKQFQIDLGIMHDELDLPWDKPVPEDQWERVADYCVNDVISTEAVFNDRVQDFVARKILAELSGLTVNHTTATHTAKIVFGDSRNHNDSFVDVDLSKTFPGYQFDGKESTYHGETVGEGGYVYAEKGVHYNVTVLDVASMHPTSIVELNHFGPYTKNFKALLDARLAIKRKDYEALRVLLDGKLAKFVGDDESTYDLAYALKIVINIVYGLTAARFDNPFRSPRNHDNVVAKRGALFMVDLKRAVQAKGFQVVHIKTDSIKIPDASPEIIQFVYDFGEKYGYTFELDVVYDKMCLVNDVVYVAFDGDNWSAVGAQFQHPYVFKKLFSREPLEFDDFCEPRHVVKGTMYLDFGDHDDPKDMLHVGRTGLFVPVIKRDGGRLLRANDDKLHAVKDTSGYYWITSDMAKERDKKAELLIDMSYFDELEKKAVDKIEEFVEFYTFVGNES